MWESGTASLGLLLLSLGFSVATDFAELQDTQEVVWLTFAAPLVNSGTAATSTYN